MKRYLLFLLLNIALLAGLAGQTPCGAAYTRIVEEGDVLLKKGLYKEAFEKFRAARGCTEAEHQVLDKKTAEVLHAVDGEREKADKSAALARQQQKKAEAALKLAEEEKTKAEAAEEKATAVLDKIYFYEDRFGLAYENGRYGFIDKNLKTKIDFRYIEAMPFDYTGFAWVKKEGEGLSMKQIDFLIDTLGNEYPLAYDIAEINDSTTALDLRSRDLDSLPPTVCNQTQLKILLLGRNQLTHLPPEIGNLKNLIFLGLSRNKLEQLPPELGRLENLAVLQVFDNELSAFPTTLGNLKKLITLDLSYNDFRHFPSAIVNMEALENLNFSNNKLNELPPALGNLQNLRMLNFDINKLTQIPPELGKLKSLTALNLSWNKLTQLPVELWNLKNLTTLELSLIELSQVPPELGNLINLKTLDLSNNYLRDLPIEVANLGKLQAFNLHENPLSQARQEKLRKLLPNCALLFSRPLGEVYEDFRAQLFQIAQSMEAQLQAGDTTLVMSEMTDNYNSLAWYQLLTGQFFAAEKSIRRGLELDPTNPILYTNLPAALIFQKEPFKEAEAFKLYTAWKNKDFGDRKYSDVFLDDFKAFELAGIIPPFRQAAVDRVKKLLEE